ncbi:MAG: hypothetical protein VW499_01510 [Candidatus Puniceispirillum sp.]
MSQTTAQDRLRAQIEAARRGLGDTALPSAANDSAQPAATTMPARPQGPEPEFQFFHRKQGPVDAATAGGTASTRAAFDSLQGRVQHLEGAIALHHKHTLELINLLSQVDTKTLRPAGKSIRRMRAKQQFLFWLVLGLLGVGWVGLTPAGHAIINHFLALL